MIRTRIRRGAMFALLLAGSLTVARHGEGQEKPALKGTASAFAGMVEVPAGSFKMGADERTFEKQFKPSDRRKWHKGLLGPHGQFLWWCLLTETPEHTETTEAYAIDRYCVTNAQYEKFLQQTCQTTVFIAGVRRTIAQVGRELVGKNAGDADLATILWMNWDKLERLKARVYADNEALLKAALDGFNAGMPPGAQAKDFDSLPEKDWVRAWTDFRLPDDTALIVYSRRVPAHWPRGKVTPEIAALPVVRVSAGEADDFAAWAGKHVPTEAEWEKAARGPDGTLWPWGGTWNPDAQKDLLHWVETTQQMNGGLAPDFRDNPVAVDAFPESQSGYGCFQMLGNVLQWTSSLPGLYPGSKAESKDWFGREGYRVLRGSAYGEGMKDKGNDLIIRNTRRLLAEGENEGVTGDSWYVGFGFRCAKYHVPARDVTSRLFARLAAIGSALPKPEPDRGLVFDPATAYGVELNAYAGPGAEGPGKIFVTGPTRIVSVLPLERLPYSTTKHLVAAQENRKPEDPPVLLALLFWNSDIAIDLIELVEQRTAQPMPGPEAGGPEAPAGGNEAEPGGDEGGSEEGGEEGRDGGGDGGEEGQPAPAPEEPKPAGPKPPPVEVKIVERRGYVPCDPKGAYFLGIENGRLALIRKMIAGYRIAGWFPPLEEGVVAPPLTDQIVKGNAKEIRRGASIDPATGIVTISLAIPTGSKMSSDVYGLTVKFRVKGGLAGAWESTTE